MTGIKYKRGPVPIFKKLGDIKQHGGFDFVLFVFKGDAGNCYLLMRKETPKNGVQIFGYITHESAFELIQDNGFEKTDYCREFLATQPPEPAKKQWDLKTIFREEP
jgi:hypothetical protein